MEGVHMNKTCTKCNSLLPNTVEFFSMYKARNITGLRHACKKCIKESSKNYFANNKEKLLAKQKVYNEKHRKEIQEWKNKWYQDNREMILKRTYERRINNYEEHLEGKKKYRIKNKDRIKEQQKMFYLNNKDKRLQSTKYRRTKMKGLLADFTSAQWVECKIHFNHSCAYCGNNKVSMTQDHFIPVNNGGELSITNIVPVCKTCNSSKQDKDFLKWYSAQEFYSRDREQKIFKYLKYDKIMNQQLALL